MLVTNVLLLVVTFSVNKKQSKVYTILIKGELRESLPGRSCLVVQMGSTRLSMSLLKKDDGPVRSMARQKVPLSMLAGT